MIAVLGIDAAWTSIEPSGVALAVGEGSEWRIRCVAPSYEAFIACASGHQLNWQSDSIDGSAPDVNRLLSAARSMAGIDPTLVAVDMPLSDAPISARRHADRAISQTFGKYGCSTHTPSASRPGPLGSGLMTDLRAAGYPLISGKETASLKQGTIEVYPHPALLILLGRDYRVPYKVNKSGKYWKGASVAERIDCLLKELFQIENGLRLAFGDIPFSMPSSTDVRSLRFLKRYEDALDAMVCAWVGRMFIEGNATAYGDDTSAIWVPSKRRAA